MTTLRSVLLVLLIGSITFVAWQTSAASYLPNPSISTNGSVRVVYIQGTVLYIGGEFTQVNDDVGTHSRSGCAAYDLTTGRVTRFKADIDRGMVRTMVLGDTLLYLGGTFTKVNKVKRAGCAAVNPATGGVAPGFRDDKSSIDGPVFALGYLDGRLYVGGNYTEIDSVFRHYLSALDGVTGKVIPEFDPSPGDSMNIDQKMAGGVWTIETLPGDADNGDSGSIIVGGNFQTVATVNDAKFIAALSPSGMAGALFVDEMYEPVIDLDEKNGVLYAALGGFGNRAAAFSLVAGEGYKRLWRGFVVQGDVQAVACSDSGYLYFSFHQGLFDTTDYYRCAVLDAATGNLYDTLPTMSSFFGVWSIDAEGDFIALGGTFRQIGKKRQDYLALFGQCLYPVPNIPEVVQQISPENGEIVATRSAELAWRFTSFTSVYEIEISRDSQFIEKNLVLNDVVNTIRRVSGLDRCSNYYWRIRGKNGKGIGEWSTTRHFITPPGENEIPELVAPVDNSAGLPLEFDCIWSPTVTGISYIVQVSEDGDFYTRLIDRKISGTASAEIKGLAPNSSYYLRICAETIGGPTAWTTVSFTTVPWPPDAPHGVYPVNNTRQVGCSPTFKWTEAARTDTYRLQIAEDQEFSTMLVDTFTFADSCGSTRELPKNHCCYWRVITENAGGKASSDAMRFTTEIPLPEPPVPCFPGDGALVQDDTVHFLWSRADISVTSYRLEVFRDSMASVPLISILTTDTSFSMTGIDGSVSLLWHVKAINESGAGAYCATALFSRIVPQFLPEYHFGVKRYSLVRGIGNLIYTLPYETDVRILLSDLKGNGVWSLHRRSVPAGEYSDYLDFRRLPVGAYIMSLQTSAGVRRIRTMLIK